MTNKCQRCDKITNQITQIVSCLNVYSLCHECNDFLQEYPAEKNIESFVKIKNNQDWHLEIKRRYENSTAWVMNNIEEVKRIIAKERGYLGCIK